MGRNTTCYRQRLMAMPLLFGLAALALGQGPALPKLIVAGDSTASNTDRQGWGDPFADYFDATKITVLNRARGGAQCADVLQRRAVGQDRCRPPAGRLRPDSIRPQRRRGAG